MNAMAYWKKKRNIIIREIVDTSGGVVPEAAPFRGVAVWFTKVGPHARSICCAAALYVLLTGCVLFPANEENMAITSCRHVLHVGRAPPGRLTPSGR